MRIFLLGYMASGKSTLGKLLAKKLKFRFADLDELIEAKTKKSIQEIFEEDGEIFFREKEKNVLHETIKLKNHVIATGGGTPCFFDNMEWMNQNGTTVFLETNVGILFRRLAQSKSSRPLVKNLTDIELMEFIVEQTTIRQRFYKKSQHKISGDFSVEKNAEQLLKFLKALK